MFSGIETDASASHVFVTCYFNISLNNIVVLRNWVVDPTRKLQLCGTWTETADAHDFTDPTIFCGDLGRAHQIPIPAMIEHGKGCWDRKSVRSYVLTRDLVYHEVNYVPLQIYGVSITICIVVSYLCKAIYSNYSAMNMITLVIFNLLFKFSVGFHVT
jgi:hypothetical protein